MFRTIKSLGLKKKDGEEEKTKKSLFCPVGWGRALMLREVGDDQPLCPPFATLALPGGGGAMASCSVAVLPGILDFP